MLDPTGFWSYASSDDAHSRGRLSQLRAMLAAELQQQVGRRPKVNIFQDVAAIPPGEEWERQIRLAIAQSSFLIPIITPALLQSEWCCTEIKLFAQRTQAIGLANIIFPIHYVDTDHVDPGNDELCQDPDVLHLLRTRQWTDFRGLRFRNQDSEDVAQFLERLARSILGAIRQPRIDRSSAPPSDRVIASKDAQDDPGGSPTTENDRGDSIIVLAERPVLQLAGSAVWDDGFREVSRCFTRLEDYLTERMISVAGPPMAVFTQTDHNGFRFIAMVPVTAAPERIPPDLPGDMAFDRSPDGKVVRFRHEGPYDEIDQTYGALTRHVERQQFETKNMFAEVFVHRVDTADDPALHLEIYAWLV